MDDSSRRLPLRNTRTILRAFGHPCSRKGRTRIIRSSWVANFGPRPMSHHSTTGRLDSGLGALATSMRSSASASRGELAIAQVPPVSTLVTRLGPLATAVIVPCLAQRLVALERCHRLLAGAHVLGRGPSCLNRLLRRALNPRALLDLLGRGRPKAREKAHATPTSRWAPWPTRRSPPKRGPGPHMVATPESCEQSSENE